MAWFSNFFILEGSKKWKTDALVWQILKEIYLNWLLLVYIHILERNYKAMSSLWFNPLLQMALAKERWRKDVKDSHKSHHHNMHVTNCDFDSSNDQS